jgi:two-component system, cell cycle sensor histidine kinase and response regulator CckA
MSAHILVVDDEDFGRDAIALLLISGGHAVEAVASGPEALARLEAKSFDMVVTDNAMPGMNGLDLARAVKARFPALPVVLFSGCPPDKLMPEVDLVLQKPQDIPLLRQAVRQLLEERANPAERQ